MATNAPASVTSPTGEDNALYRQLKEEYQRPATFKAKTNLNELERNLRIAMVDVGFNLQHVKSNGSKLATKQFDHLVKKLDKTHETFVKNLLSDKSVDKQKVLAQYGDSYTNKLRRHQLQTGTGGEGTVGNAERSSQGNSDDELEAEIAKKNLTDKYNIEFIGVKSKINTNRPLTLEQKKKNQEKQIKADKLSRKLNSQFNQEVKRARKSEKQLEQLGARLDQVRIMKQQVSPGHSSGAATTTFQGTRPTVQSDDDLATDDDATALLFAEQPVSPNRGGLLARSAVQTERLMQSNAFAQRLNQVMLDAQRRAVMEDVDECNLRLSGWNHTLQVGEQFFDAKMDNQEANIRNVALRNEKTLQKQSEFENRPRSFFEQIQPLEKPSKEKVLEEKLHGVDYMRMSRSEYCNEQRLQELLNRTNIDMVQQLRQRRQKIKDARESIEDESEMRRLKANLIKNKYTDLEMTTAPTGDLTRSLAQLKAQANDKRGLQEFYKNKGLPKRFSRPESDIGSATSPLFSCRPRSRTQKGAVGGRSDSLRTLSMDRSGLTSRERDGEKDTRIAVVQEEQPVDSRHDTPVFSSDSKMALALERSRVLKALQGEKPIDRFIRLGLEKVHNAKLREKEMQAEQQLRSTQTTLWQQLENDMIHKANHLDPYKAVMHSRKMIKQASIQNVGRAHFEKLQKRTDEEGDGSGRLGPLLQNKATFSHVILTPDIEGADMDDESALGRGAGPAVNHRLPTVPVKTQKRKPIQYLKQSLSVKEGIFFKDQTRPTSPTEILREKLQRRGSVKKSPNEKKQQLIQAYSQGMADLEKEQKKQQTSRRDALFTDSKTGRSSTDITNRLLNTIHLADSSVLNKKEAEFQLLPLLKENPRYHKQNRLTMKESEHSNLQSARRREKHDAEKNAFFNQVRQMASNIVREAGQLSTERQTVTLNFNQLSNTKSEAQLPIASKLEMRNSSAQFSANNKHSETQVVRRSINDDQAFIRQQVLTKAQVQRQTLMYKLMHIESKKVKGVKDTLDKGEIVEKIKAADKFIERLKHGGEDSPAKHEKFDGHVIQPGSAGFAAESDLNFLQSIVEHSVPLKGGIGSTSLNELKDLIGSVKRTNSKGMN